MEGWRSGAGTERGRSEVGVGWETDAAAFGRESAAGWELVSEADGASLPRGRQEQQTDVWRVASCCLVRAGLDSSDLEVEMEAEMWQH